MKVDATNIEYHEHETLYTYFIRPEDQFTADPPNNLIREQCGGDFKIEDKSRHCSCIVYDVW